MAIDAKGTISIFDATDDIYASGTEPENKVVDMLWLNTTTNVLKRWTGSAWADVVDARVAGLAETVTAQETSITLLEGQIDLKASIETVDQLTARVSNAEQSITPSAIVSAVRSSEAYLQDLDTINEAVDALTDKTDGKTTVYYQDGAPAAPSGGDLWYDTDADPVKIYKWAVPESVDWIDFGTSDATSGTGGTAALRQWFEQAVDAGSYDYEITLSGTSDNTGGGYSGDEALVLKTASGNADRNGTQLVRLTLAQVMGGTSFSGTVTVSAAVDCWYLYLRPYMSGMTAHLRLRVTGADEGTALAWTDVTTPTLSAALKAAGDAQSTADGKIVTYSQAAAPDTGMTVGDLWIDTDDKNKLYRWNGTEWAASDDARISENSSNIEQLANQITMTVDSAMGNRLKKAELKISSNAITSRISDSAGYVNPLGILCEVYETFVSGGLETTTVFYTDTDPDAAVAGDIWYDISDNPVVIKRFTGTSDSGTRGWTNITSDKLKAALTSAQGDRDAVKFCVKTTGPRTLQQWDFWFDSDDGYKPYRWVSPNWVAVDTSKISDVYSTITQTANSIRSEVADVEEDLQSSITQTASAIRSEVAAADAGLQSSITQTADKIVMAVGGKAAEFKQTAAPASGMTEGDIWQDTDDNGKLYVYTNGAWKALSANRIHTSKVNIDEDSVDISTDTFTVNIPSADAGHSDFRVDTGGVYAPVITSPTVFPATPISGLHVVGSGGTWNLLSEAFTDISNRGLCGDLTLRVNQPSGGGTQDGGELTGVVGGYGITIMPPDLVWRHRGFMTGADGGCTITYNSNNGVTVTATTAGTYRRGLMFLARIDDMNLRGKEVTICYESATGTYIPPVLTITKANETEINWGMCWNANQANTPYTYIIPDNAPEGGTLALLVGVCHGTACAAGAQAVYNNLRVQIGASVIGWPDFWRPVSGKLVIADCQAKVSLAGLDFLGGLTVRNSTVAVQRCEFSGDIGLVAEQSRVSMRECYGDCSTAVLANASIIQLMGSMPSGDISGWLVGGTYTQSEPTASIDPVEGPVFEGCDEIKAASTGTYQGGNWYGGDRAVRQGSTTDGRIRFYARR